MNNLMPVHLDAIDITRLRLRRRIEGTDYGAGIFSWQIVSRKKPAIGSSVIRSSADGKQTTIDTLDSYVARRDYTGAIARLQVTERISMIE